ncbi:MAG: NAD-dependent epimerase/dehydratase family protein [Clostridiales bacterium]|nr:NAD-dependent epimerase/dehydratase family protein [Clostridiales bacterium]
MKRALVCGAGGFIGGHLAKRLKKEGYWIRGVDIKEHEFSYSHVDEFLLLDLRKPENCIKALRISDGPFDEVYQLAADMGGMGFISFAECEVLYNNALINLHMTHYSATMGIPLYFFSSSVCIYRDMKLGEPELSENDAYPANPHNEYGWEKLYSERVALAYSRRYGMKVRIGRFQNCYGPEGTWRAGREKAPAAICRKVAEAENNSTIEVWGDGTAVRSYIYVDDLIEAVLLLIHSGLEGPINIGSPEYFSVKELVNIVAEIAGKRIGIKWIEGPVGVQSRNFSNIRINSLGWRPKVSFKEGIRKTYEWIEEQVRKNRSERFPQ